MKRLIVLLLVVVLVCTLAACGNNNPAPTKPTGGENTKPSASQPDANENTSGNSDATAYFFMAGAVKLVPCAPFDASALPEPSSTFEVPSCAFEGTDKVYNYETYEITAFHDGEKEVIYSIYLIEPSVTTPEGLAVGDDAADVKKLYGEPQQINGNEWKYTSGDTEFLVMVNKETVISIEYRGIIALNG